MQTDTTSRVLLAGILVCLLILILQNFFEAPAEVTVPMPVAAVAEPEPQSEREGRRNKRGQVMTDADIVIMAQAAANEALPVDMRVWSALQLEGLSHQHAFDTLIDLLDQENETLAIAALQALAGHRDPRIVEAARRAAEHEEEGVRQVAKYVMERSYPDGAPSP